MNGILNSDANLPKHAENTMDRTFDYRGILREITPTNFFFTVNQKETVEISGDMKKKENIKNLPLTELAEIVKVDKII